MKKLILLLVVVSLIGCKKGDEDPGISFRSRTTRLEGKWQVSKYFYDSEDILLKYTSGLINESQTSAQPSCVYLKPYTTTTSTKLYYEFEKDGNLEEINISDDVWLDPVLSVIECRVKYYEHYDEWIESGSWEFGSKKETLVIFLWGEKFEYELIELSNKEMKWYGTNADATQELTLIKL